VTTKVASWQKCAHWNRGVPVCMETV